MLYQFLQNAMTVVERNEWVPSGRFRLSEDDLTGTRAAVIYAKVPLTAADEDGMLLRLMGSSALGDRMYFIRVLKNREVYIGKSFRNSDGEETDTVQVV